MTNWYSVLEVAESASPEMIRASWRLLQRRYHPDNQTTGDLEKAKQVNIAHDILSDPDRRAQFDKELDQELARSRPAHPHQNGAQEFWPPPGFGNVNPDAYPNAYTPGEIDLGAVARDVLIDASIEIGGAFLSNVMGQMSPFARKAFLDAIAKRRQARQRQSGEKTG